MEQGNGEREKVDMKKKIQYSKAPVSIARAIDASVKVKDFLPPPDRLVDEEDNIKITIQLSKKSVNFFKKNALKSGISYQRMIKKVLDLYAEAYSNK